jgi:predicted esterase
MKARWSLLWFLVVTAGALAEEQSIVSRFDAPLSPAARKLSAIGGNPPATTAKCGVAFPKGFDARKPHPIFVWNSAQTASAVDGMAEIARTATDAGWVALAADAALPARVETTEWCVAMLMAAFDRLERSWPDVRKCPVAVGGFSGGAKRSVYIGAALMEQKHPLIGMFWGGCNEDRTADALRWHKPGDAYKTVRIALSTGTSDPIVPPERAKSVLDSLASAGFKTLRSFPYEGQHTLDRDQLREALLWFRSQTPK